MKILLLVVPGLLIGLVLSFLFLNKKETLKTPTAVISREVSPTAIAASVGKPQRIKIPSLNVDAKVEWVGVDNAGNMDIPSDFNNTAWYSPGPKPGEKGSAVIDGHVDNPRGEPAVFAKITGMLPGDIIQVFDENNKVYKFSVVKVEDYDLETIPLTKIFSREGPSMLNLITCAGVYDREKKMYNKRTVVYANLVNNP